MARVLCFFLLLFPLVPIVDAAEDTDDVALLSEIKMIECREKIMSINGDDLDGIAPNKVIEACQGFPLSDDVAVQILGAMIGPDFVSVLDVLSSFTKEPHGFSRDDLLFSILSPMHTTLYYFNVGVFSVFVFLVFWHSGLQVLRWQQGGTTGDSVKIYLQKYGVSGAVKGFLAFPFLGWVNPIQFIALLSVSAFLWLSKIAVTYLFLASFFTNVGSTIKDSVEDSIKNQVGASILNYTCDIEQREALIKSIQENNEGAQDMAYVQENELYKCLMGVGQFGASLSNEITQVTAIDAGVDTYLVTPKTLSQTKQCVTEYEQTIASWGEDPDTFTSCGETYISLPSGASTQQVENALDVYMNDDIETDKRNVALKLQEMVCREGDLPDFKGGVVANCFVARVKGDSYEYGTTTDTLSGVETLAYYGLPLSVESKDLLKEEVMDGADGIRESITSKTSALIDHFSDLLSLLELDGMTDSEKEKMDAQMDEWKAEIADSGSLGVNQADVDNVILSIRRGVWSSGTLFFGSVSESMDDKRIVKTLAQVYKVSTGYDLIDAGQKYWALLQMIKPSGTDTTSNLINGNIGHGMILPRLGLYLDNIDCWLDQTACETPALNPFTELSKRGIEIIDHATYGIIATKGVRTTLTSISKQMLELAGYDPSEAAKTKMGKYMIFDTFEEIYILYLLIGFVLVVIIPGIPLLKITTMLVAWLYDVIKEILVITLKIILSPAEHIEEGFVSDAVKDAFHKIIGLGLYFLFFLIGIIVMFVMFSFFYSLNVLVVGALDFVMQWSMEMSSLESMVMGVIMDTVIVGILLYEMRVCTPYIERLPREMAAYFNLESSNTDGVVKHAENILVSKVFVKVSALLHGGK
ncbi:hypothetical protein [Alteromonas sp. 14N.309.X.WAT.G.H12]|uniref:hypothetical protein n=1 Tax=Alteromonas sp. 14N.309.X.WAT.G.H12 TaxID=3120824 RepID=UPI002FD2CD20